MAALPLIIVLTGGLKPNVYTMVMLGMDVDDSGNSITFHEVCMPNDALPSGMEIFQL